MRREVFFFARKIPQPYLSLSWLAGSHYYGKLACHDMSYSRNPKRSFNDYSLGLFPSRWPFLGSCPANPMSKWSAHWMWQVLRSCSAMPSRDLQKQTKHKNVALCKGLCEMEKMGCLQASLHCISTLNLPLTEWQHTLILQEILSSPSIPTSGVEVPALEPLMWRSIGGMRWWCRKLGGFCPS